MRRTRQPQSVARVNPAFGIPLLSYLPSVGPINLVNGVRGFVHPYAATALGPVTIGVDGAALHGATASRTTFGPFPACAEYTLIAVIRDHVGRGSDRIVFGAVDTYGAGAAFNLSITYQNILNLAQFTTTNTLFNATAAVQTPSAAPFVVVGRLSGNELAVYNHLGAKSTTTIAGTPRGILAGQKISLGASGAEDQCSSLLLGDIYAAAIYPFALPEFTIQSIIRDRWSLFAPSRRVWAQLSAANEVLDTGVGSAAGASAVVGVSGSVGAAAGTSVALASSSLSSIASATGSSAATALTGSIAAASGAGSATAYGAAIAVAGGVGTAAALSGAVGSAAGASAASARSGATAIATGTSAAIARSGAIAQAAGSSTAAAYSSAASVASAAGTSTATARSGSIGQAAGTSTAAGYSSAASIAAAAGSSSALAIAGFVATSTAASSAIAVSGAIAAAAGTSSASATSSTDNAGVGSAVGSSTGAATAGAVGRSFGSAAAVAISSMPSTLLYPGRVCIAARQPANVAINASILACGCTN